MNKNVYIKGMNKASERLHGKLTGNLGQDGI